MVLEMISWSHRLVALWSYGEWLVRRKWLIFWIFIRACCPISQDPVNVDIGLAGLTSMRCFIGLFIILTLGGCSHRGEREREAQREREESDRNSAAFKVGEAAHEIAKHAEKTAAAAERKLEDSARKASEGWKQKDREDREKARETR
jgi:hypothetical protein